MQSSRSTILHTLAVLGFVLLSMTPRGMALCVGGGHELAEALAGWCDEHGGHVHADQPQAEHDHGPCGDHHDHEEHSAPCADIPLGLDECRPQDSTATAHVTALLPASPIAMPAPMRAAVEPEAQVQLRNWERSFGVLAGAPPAALQCSLRAVVLLI